MKIYYKFSQKIILFILKLFLNLKIVGMDKIKNKKGVIICANHQSYFDPPFLGSILPIETYYLAKSELFKNKILGALITLFNAIPIKRDRYSGSSIKRCEKLIFGKKNLLIFPEGSRRSMTVKPGIGRIAFNTKAAIYPVKIENIKNFKECFFRRKYLTFIFRKPICPEYYENLLQRKVNYKAFAQIVLNRINGIGESGN